MSYNVLRYVPLAFASRLWKWLTNSPPIYGTVLGTVLEQFSEKQSSPFMEMAGKQSSPLMEMVAPQRRIYLGSAQNDYRIALDKESHFSNETTVTMPYSQKFPLLMSL
jgi:hypothetical protein